VVLFRGYSRMTHAWAAGPVPQCLSPPPFEKFGMLCTCGGLLLSSKSSRCSAARDGATSQLLRASH
jgi:hypothetical protein